MSPYNRWLISKGYEKSKSTEPSQLEHLSDEMEADRAKVEQYEEIELIDKEY